MHKTIEDIQEAVLNMQPKEKDKLLLQLLKKNSEAIQKFYYQHLCGEGEIEDLVSDLKNEIYSILASEYNKAGNTHKNVAKGMGNVSKLINKYSSALNHQQQCELYMYILEFVFNKMSHLLGTCWTVFDIKVAQTLSKAITLTTKRMHEDFRVEFEGELNHYLTRIKSTSSHLNCIYNLPKKI